MAFVFCMYLGLAALAFISFLNFYLLLFNSDICLWLCVFVVLSFILDLLFYLFPPDLILCSFTDLALLCLRKDKFLISSFTHTPSCEMEFTMVILMHVLSFNVLHSLKLIGLVTRYSHDHDISRSMSIPDLL